MNKMMSFLNESTLPAWVTTTVPIVRYVLIGIIALCAIMIIVLVMCQSSSNDEGSNALTGGATDSYYAQNKFGTNASKLQKLTIWCASLIVVFSVLYFLSFLVFQGV